MNRVSKFMLAVTAATLIFSPAAYAQKEKKDKKSKKEAAAAAVPAEPQPQLSKEFRAAYQLAVAPFVKNDFAGASAAWPLARAAIQNDDDKYQAGIFAVQLGGKLNDKELSAEGYDLLLESSFTSLDTRQQILFQKAANSYDGKDYPAAEVKMIAAYDAGYRGSDIEALIATTFSQQKKYAEAVSWIQRGIDAKLASGQAVPINFYRQAAGYAVRLDDNPTITKVMKHLVKAEDNADNWRDMLNLYMRKAALSEAETLDVMRLMRSKNAMKYPVEYALYVESLGARRYPVETLSVLQAGIDAGHIEASDTDIKDHLTAARAVVDEDIRGLPSAEKQARTSASGNLISLTGDALFSQGKYAEAQSLYELALTKGSIVDNTGQDRTDRTIMRLGITKAYQKDWAGAKAELAKITSGKRKDIAEYWMIYIDQEMAGGGGV